MLELSLLSSKKSMLDAEASRLTLSQRSNKGLSSSQLMSTHNLNDDTKGAFRVTLRAVAKPGLALSCDGWRPKPLHGRRSNVQTTQRQRRGRPPPTPSPDSRSSRDAGSLSHSTPAARGCWLIACVDVPPCPPGQTVQDGTQARTAALERAAACTHAHCQAGAC